MTKEPKYNWIKKQKISLAPNVWRQDIFAQKQGTDCIPSTTPRELPTLSFLLLDRSSWNHLHWKAPVTICLDKLLRLAFTQTFSHRHDWSLMADRLEVPVEAAIQLEVVPSLQRDWEHEGLVLNGALLLLLLTGLLLDLLVDVLGRLALWRVHTQLAIVKGKGPAKTKLYLMFRSWAKNTWWVLCSQRVYQSCAVSAWRRAGRQEGDGKVGMQAESVFPSPFSPPQPSSSHHPLLAETRSDQEASSSPGRVGGLTLPSSSSSSPPLPSSSSSPPPPSSCPEEKQGASCPPHSSVGWVRVAIDLPATCLNFQWKTHFAVFRYSVQLTFRISHCIEPIFRKLP